MGLSSLPKYLAAACSRPFSPTTSSLTIIVSFKKLCCKERDMSWCGHNGVNITSAGPAELGSSRVTPPPQLYFPAAQSRIHPRDAQRTQPCVYGETISADSLRHVVPAAQRARSVVYVSHHPTPHHPLTLNSQGQAKPSSNSPSPSTSPPPTLAPSAPHPASPWSPPSPPASPRARGSCTPRCTAAAAISASETL